tara:strand:+ start:69175 stop:69729 length:555 start_codon:yes stop_codon:yes gene_type:complete
MFKIDKKTHKIANAVFIESPNHDDRPIDVDIDSIIIHCISLPEGSYDNQNVVALFQNKLDTSAHKSFSSLAGLRVSSHLFVRRNGSIIQFVPFNKRAWHAGTSSHEGRENFNDFSIGIELEGTSNSSYEKEQYDILKDVIDSLKSCYPMIEESRILGHCDISPDRKTDPGPLFDWTKLKEKNLC